MALKCIKQEDGDGKGFPVTAMREMRILRQLKHKVRVYEGEGGGSSHLLKGCRQLLE